ncbi:alpha/beta hydrolase [Myceligenerans crystallogenes]|uniref:Alpha/beta hydrolase n=1 Tax=Myceligenerans crystallogenes TaxID=316335 RepID=A0ABP4ZWR8_9MICO
MFADVSRKGFLTFSAVAGAVMALPATAARAAENRPGRTIEESEIRLWPGEAPGSEGLGLTEVVTERSTDPKVRDRVVTGVSTPTIRPFLPEPGQATGAAALVVPGGGYTNLVYDKEGVDIARWLASAGVAAFVLKHRLPGEGHQLRQYVPLQDLQRATRIIRHRAAEWDIDVARVGTIGFSAGGHAATTLATKSTALVYARVDAADQLNATPDFVMLGYPVVSMKAGVTHRGSRDALLGPAPSPDLVDAFSGELQVTGGTPRTFIVQAHNDWVSTENSVLYYRALKAAGVEAEMHIFRSGGHGFGIRNARASVASWPQLASAWLEEGR